MKRLIIFGCVALALLFIGMRLARGHEASGLRMTAADGSAPALEPSPVSTFESRPLQSVHAAPAAGGRIMVDVEGAVREPGVHEIARGGRVFAAISAAGGPLPDADIAGVDRAEIAEDGVEIIVPRRGEREAAAGAAHAGRHKHRRRKHHAAAASDSSQVGSRPDKAALVVDASETGSSSEPPHRRLRRRSRHANGPAATALRSAPVDLEHASADELATVPGSNAVLARRIVALRDIDGGFDSLDDLLDVEGMNESRLERMATALKLDR